jgi:hypothetical protein
MCALVTGAALAYWFATALVDCRYYGEHVTVTCDRGYLAVYWGGMEDDRNSRVLNNFEWPDFPPSGAGTQWSLDRWGRWVTFGPSLAMVRYKLEHPRNFGFFWPSIGRGYVGSPAWIVGMTGGVGYAACRRRHRSATACARCGYERGTSARCPECGVEATEQPE